VLAAGCAARRFAPPAVPPEPAPEAAAAWDEARAACQTIHVYQAALGVSGRISNHRIPGFASAALNLAVTDEGRIGLEALVSSEMLFRLGGEADAARLLLVQDRRVVDAPAAAILDALIGVRLDPRQLLGVLSGCLLGPSGFTQAHRLGTVLRLASGDTTLYLERRDGAWRPRAGALPGVTVDYQQLAGGLPRQLTLRSEGAGRAAVITIRVHDAVVNPSLPDAAFVVAVPADVRPMTLDELREASF
jgi:hypothetical protein